MNILCQSAWTWTMFMLSLLLAPCIAEGRNVFFDTPEHCNKTFTVDPKNYVNVKGGESSSSNNNNNISFSGSVLIFQATSADDHLCVQINQLSFKNDNLQLDYYDSPNPAISEPAKTFKQGDDYELPVKFCSTGQTISLQLKPRHQTAKISDVEIDIQVANIQVLNKSHRKGTTVRPIPVWSIAIIVTAIIISAAGLGMVTILMRKGKDRNRLPLMDAKQCRCLLAIRECNPALCVVTEAADSESEDDDYWACPKSDCGSTNQVQRGHCKLCDTPKPVVMVKMHGRYAACDTGDNGSGGDVETGLDNITDGRVETEICDSAVLDKDVSVDIEGTCVTGCHSNTETRESCVDHDAGSSAGVDDCGMIDSGDAKPKTIYDNTVVKGEFSSMGYTKSCVTETTYGDVATTSDGVDEVEHDSDGVADGDCAVRADDSSRDDVIVDDVTKVRQQFVDGKDTSTDVADVGSKDDVVDSHESSGCSQGGGDASEQEDKICAKTDNGTSNNSVNIDSEAVCSTPGPEIKHESPDGLETDVQMDPKCD